MLAATTDISRERNAVENQFIELMSDERIVVAAPAEGGVTLTGTGAGQNLVGAGMNVNLAPVLDVYCASGNFIDQYQRSYSDLDSGQLDSATFNAAVQRVTAFRVGCTDVWPAPRALGHALARSCFHAAMASSVH